MFQEQKGHPEGCPSFLNQSVEQTDYRSHKGQEKPHGQPIGRPTLRLAGFELDDCEHLAFLHLVRDGPLRQPRSRIRPDRLEVTTRLIPPFVEPPNTLRL
jgi:hypothetical protein